MTQGTSVSYNGDDEEFDDREAPGEDTGANGQTGARRKRLDRILPDAIKRAIEKGLEAGIGTYVNSREALQGVASRVEGSKEVANYIFSQADETKNAMVRTVAREVREFLEAADLAKELQRALTSLSFEIRTEIRFIPNDAGGVTPQVKLGTSPKRTTPPPSAAKRRGLRRPSAEAADADDDFPADE